MTSAIANTTEQFKTSGQSLWSQVRDLFAGGTTQRDTAENIAPIAQTDHKANLLKAIDDGYIVEETGELATVPQYARAHLKAAVETGGWG